MSKIYCKNCKWFDEMSRECRVGTTDNFYFTIEKLNHMGEIEYEWKNKKEFIKECDKHGIELSFSGNPPQIIKNCKFNVKFNCPYYKRKWWRFWI